MLTLFYSYTKQAVNIHRYVKVKSPIKVTTIPKWIAITNLTLLWFPEMVSINTAYSIAHFRRFLLSVSPTPTAKVRSFFLVVGSKALLEALSLLLL